jgi:hypothetical protein
MSFTMQGLQGLFCHKMDGTQSRDSSCDEDSHLVAVHSGKRGNSSVRLYIHDDVNLHSAYKPAAFVFST